MNTLTKYEEQKNDVALLNTMAEIALKSGKYPGFDHATIMNVFFTARALNVDPFLALNSGFNIIKGKINMGAHFMVSLARRAGHSLKVLELTKDKCVMLGKRKDNDDSIKYEYTFEEAQEAGLSGKDNWKTNRKSMLYCACARHLFRMLFCDIVIPYDADEMNVEDSLTQPEDIGFPEIKPRSIAAPQISSENIAEEGELSPNEQLEQRFISLNVSTSHLKAFVKFYAEKENKTPDAFATSVLSEERFDKFKENYVKNLARISVPSEIAV